MTRRPLLALLGALAAIAVALATTQGPLELAQATVNGFVAGNYYALGAVGLTLVAPKVRGWRTSAYSFRMSV